MLSLPKETNITGTSVNLPSVLVVDDRKLIADTLANILKLSGFRVATAYDGLEALKEAERFLPDCLVSDVYMPRMNGVDLAISMREGHPNIRILFFSRQVEFLDDSLEKKARGFEFELIAKPIHPLDLIARLKS